jgi:sugar lactone lactonase YvrE
VSDVKIDVVVQANATIGEAPTWSARERALYWIDIKEPALHRVEPATGQRRRWPLTSDVGGFGLLEDASGAVVAMREGIFRLEFASGALSPLVAAPFDPALFRFNEGACDAMGRFWIGVMFDPANDSIPAQKDSLHTFTFAQGLRPQPDAAELHNGMAWSPDGRVFYLAHSQSREVFAYDFEARLGRISSRRLFVKVPEGVGVPDGAAVDTEGGYWCALHGGSRIRRYTSEGEPDIEIMLPVSQPTMCAFGGDALDILYITSARQKLSAEQLERQPLAGSVLGVRCGKRGIPRPCTVR